MWDSYLVCKVSSYDMAAPFLVKCSWLLLHPVGQKNVNINKII